VAPLWGLSIKASQQALRGFYGDILGDRWNKVFHQNKETFKRKEKS
jgi:hypothetical protein